MTSMAGFLCFCRLPQFSFREDAESGGLLSVVSFQIAEFESGASQIRVSCSFQSLSPANEVFGHDDMSGYDTSPVVAFNLVARTRNYPPSVDTIPDLVVVEDDPGPMLFLCWLTHLSAGSPYETHQSVQISPVDTSVILGSYAYADMVASLHVTPHLDSGCASVNLTLLPDANGVLQIKLAIEDDGGTDNSGQNRLVAPMMLRVKCINDRPSVSLLSSPRISADMSQDWQHLRFQSYFSVAPPPLDEAQQLTTFVVAAALDNGNHEVFTNFTAAVVGTGDLALSLPPALYGNITLSVTVEEDLSDIPCCWHNASGTACPYDSYRNSSGASFRSEPLQLRLSVERTPLLADFVMLSYFAALESSGVHNVSIDNITGTSFPRFTVTASNPKLFRAHPEASCIDGPFTCSLRFELAETVHGTSTMTVQMAGIDPNHTVIERTKVLVFKVIPNPVVQRVLPAIGRLQGGAKVTIIGRHFGSVYSRGFGSDQDGYASISVSIAGNTCGDVEFISDTMVTCNVPPGIPGMCALHVNISDGFHSRGANSNFTYMHMLVAGAHQQGGFLGVVTGIQAMPSIEMMRLELNKAVRSVVYSSGAIYVGGSFTTANGLKVGYILSYDGAHASHVGQGVDGAVHSMTLFKGPASQRALLVVGGSFYTAMTNATMSVTGSLAGEIYLLALLLACLLPRGNRCLSGRPDEVCGLSEPWSVKGTLVCRLGHGKARVGVSRPPALRRPCRRRTGQLHCLIRRGDEQVSALPRFPNRLPVPTTDACKERAPTDMLDHICADCLRCSLGEHRTSMLSRFDGNKWTTPVGASHEYISHGSVESLCISPRGDLLIGGSFSLHDKAAFLVRWDGRSFHQLEVILVRSVLLRQGGSLIVSSAHWVFCVGRWTGGCVLW